MSGILLPGRLQSKCINYSLYISFAKSFVRVLKTQCKICPNGLMLTFPKKTLWETLVFVSRRKGQHYVDQELSCANDIL